ncbi:MAG: type II toxin-antitoxin system VapC family toxin [Anaeromyxobacteraceae bacterium]
MSSFVIADTSVLLAAWHDRDRASLRTVARLLEERRLVTTSVVVAEFLGGETTDALAQAQREDVIAFMPRVLPTSGAAARYAAALRRHRWQREQRVPAHPDALIAGVAAEYDLPVLTLNRRDFVDLPGVRLHPFDD